LRKQSAQHDFVLVWSALVVAIVLLDLVAAILSR
jgi:hypothetical protein